MNKDNSFAERIVALTAVKDDLFSGSFWAICWLKKRGLMPGLALSHFPVSRISDEFIELEESDPFLVESPRRWVLFPLQYPQVW